MDKLYTFGTKEKILGLNIQVFISGKYCKESFHLKGHGSYSASASVKALLMVF